MENRHEQHESRLSRVSLVKVLGSIGLSAFWVTFVWGFWDRGPFALGLNAAVYVGLLLWLFLWLLRERGVGLRGQLYWIVPLCLMCLSFFLYNDPFLKVITVPVFFVLAVTFYSLAETEGGRGVLWDARFIARIARRLLSALLFIPQAFHAFGRLLNQGNRAKKETVWRVVLGSVLFLVIAFTIVIPLLSSADAEFASRVGWLLDRFRSLFDTTIAYRTTFGIMLATLTLAGVMAWARSLAFEGTREEDIERIDPIVIGIVLGGMFAVYVLFLWVQLEKLLIGDLPFDFNDAVHLVKSGFWQLLFLSVINIVFFFLTYRRTGKRVQQVLTAFTVASSLLLVSAGHRMALYVLHYGFSYEKLFASYTVLFCAVLFVWLIARMFVPKRANILKFLVVLFMWMFAVATVLPVEQFILRANVALAQLPQSRIHLYELTMLSPDVLGTVREFQKQGKLEETHIMLPETAPGAPQDEIEALRHPDWQPWIDRMQEIIDAKAWYERTLSDLFQR